MTENSGMTDVKTNEDVVIPTLSRDDSFILIKLDENTDAQTLTVFGMTHDEALDALLNLLIVLNA